MSFTAINPDKTSSFSSFNTDGLTSDVPTRTTPTLTSTILKNIETSLVGRGSISSDPQEHPYQAGFAPPIVSFSYLPKERHQQCTDYCMRDLSVDVQPPGEDCASVRFPLKDKCQNINGIQTSTTHTLASTTLKNIGLIFMESGSIPQASIESNRQPSVQQARFVPPVVPFSFFRNQEHVNELKRRIMKSSDASIDLPRQAFLPCVTSSPSEIVQNSNKRGTKICLL